MKKIMLSLAAMFAASACAAAAQTGEAASEPAFAPTARCAIDVTRTRHGARFDVLARSVETAAGEYEFVLTKDDRGGSSDIVQGGDFDLRAGEEAVLGSSELSLERGGEYRARLRLWDANGEVCRAERRS